MQGRPRTLDRSHALAIALEGYWREGLYGMSVNEVCRRAGISKPGLYREFGGEDGLLTAVLQLYRDTVLQKLYAQLESPIPFEDVLRWFIGQLTTVTGAPPGCFLGELRLVKFDDLGVETRLLVEELGLELRENYKRWVERAQANGEVPGDLDPDMLARHLDTQISMAAMRARRGGDGAHIKAEFEIAMWRLSPGLKL